MKGFLRPIDPDLFAYYWGQGWPKELLLYLFVQKVEIQNGDDAPIVYDNHPIVEEAYTPKASEFACFGQWVTLFLSGDPHMIPREPENVDVGPVLDLGKISGFSDVLGAEKGQLSLEMVKPKTDSPHFQLKRQKRDYSIIVRAQNYRGCPEVKKNTPTPELDIKNLTSLTIKESMREALPAPAGGKIDIPSLDRIEQPVASHVHGLGVKATGDKKSGEVTQSIVLSLRSPEGVLYYLGQLMRVEQHAGLIPTMARRDENGKYTLVPLFVAFPPYGTDDNGNPFPECKQRSVSVTDGEGELYIVPRAPEQSWTDLSMEELKPGNYYSTLDSCNSGESMRVLGVLTQLIGLQKAAQDFPPTTTVRAVGQ